MIYRTVVTLDDGKKMTISVGPDKKNVIDLTIDFVLRFFKQVNVANMFENLYNSKEFENSGFKFNLVQVETDDMMACLF